MAHPWDRIAVALVLAVIGTVLTLARRHRNEDESAGVGIAGWTLFFVIWILMEGLS